MIKHRGFPGRLPGTDFQFTIRRANPKGAAAIMRRERHRDRKLADRNADSAFARALWDNFGTEPFQRGNLDAGRLCWLIGREVLAVDEDFDPRSYEALLALDFAAARISLPDALENI